MKFLNKFSVVLFIVMLFVCSSALIATAQEEVAQVPEEREGVTYDGVTYYLPKARDQIELPSSVPESTTVKSGDTLWGISSRLLNDPFLWPLIWETNMEAVPNPHLIYPDQVIKLPRGGMAIPTQAGQYPATTTPTGEPIPIGTTPDGEPIYPPLGDGEITIQQYLSSRGLLLATQDELDSCGYITQADIDVGSVISSDEEITQLGPNDIIYLNIGENDNIKAGDIFTIFIYDRIVRHPHTERIIGKLIRIRGRCRILCAHPDTSTAMIIKAYDAVYIGDKIVPYVPRKMTYRNPPPVTPFCKPSSGELTGCIVDINRGGQGVSDGVLIGTHDIVYIDKGRDDGVALGQYYAAYDHKDRGFQGDVLNKIDRGEIVIIKVDDKFSTGIVTMVHWPLSIGDFLDLKK